MRKIPKIILVELDKPINTEVLLKDPSSDVIKQVAEQISFEIDEYLVKHLMLSPDAIGHWLPPRTRGRPSKERLRLEQEQRNKNMSATEIMARMNLRNMQLEKDLK